MTQGKKFKGNYQGRYQGGYIGLMSMLLAFFIMALMAIYYFDKENASGGAMQGDPTGKSSIEKAEEAKRMIEGNNIDMSQF